MLIHFPVAFWPVHWAFHVAGSALPPGVAGIAGFWLLVAGCGFGWLAAFAGLADLLGLSRDSDPAKLRLGLWHAGINGTALMAFSALAFAEYAAYPKISHGAGLLVAEAIVLAAMFVGNYFGGAIVWRENKLPVP